MLGTIDFETFDYQCECETGYTGPQCENNYFATGRLISEAGRVVFV